MVDKTKEEELRMDKCLYHYWDFILQVRNIGSEGFFTQVVILPLDHHEFMLSNYATYRVCVRGDQPIGFIGHVNGDIRVATHPAYRGRGVAKYMLNEFMKEFPNTVAKVKAGNEASLSLFKSCGFKVIYYGLEKC